MTDYKKSSVKAVLEDNLSLKVPKGKKTKKKRNRSQSALAQQAIEAGVQTLAVDPDLIQEDIATVSIEISQS